MMHVSADHQQRVIADRDAREHGMR